jgi:hypothetical protein
VRRSFLVISFLALALATAAACEKHADPTRTTAITCERVYRVCPGLSPATEAEATACADVFQSRCGAEMRQHVQCATGKCTDAGAVDRVEVERACFATIAAYRECTETDGGPEGPDEGQLPPFDAAAAADAK